MGVGELVRRAKVIDVTINDSLSAQLHRRFKIINRK